MKKKKINVAALAAVACVAAPLAGVLSVYAASEDVVECASEAAVAKVGEVCYNSFANGVTNAASGATVGLLKDSTGGFSVGADKELVIDLGGYTLATGTDYATVDNGTVTIKNGKMIGASRALVLKNGVATLKDGIELVATAGGGMAVRAEDASTLNIEDGATLKAAYGVFTPAKVDPNKVLPNDNKSVINMTGGKILAANPNNKGSVGIFVHGTIVKAAGVVGPTINISGGEIEAASGTTGNVNDDDAQGIAQNGISTVKISGGKITADEAVGVKAGKIEITDGELKGTGDWHDPATANGSGTEATGAALSITSNSGYTDIETIRVSGGKFTSEKGYALYEGISSGSASKVEAGDLSISGGTFVGASEKSAISINSELVGAVTGGAFNSEIPEGLIANGTHWENGAVVENKLVIGSDVATLDTSSSATSPAKPVAGIANTDALVSQLMKDSVANGKLQGNADASVSFTAPEMSITDLEGILSSSDYNKVLEYMDGSSLVGIFDATVEVAGQKLTDLTAPVEVTIALPETYQISAPAGKKIEYTVIRVHKVVNPMTGDVSYEIEELPATRSEDKKFVTFETSKFSPMVLTMAVVDDTTAGTPAEEETEDDDDDTAGVGDQGTFTVEEVAGASVAALGIAAVVGLTTSIVSFKKLYKRN